MDQQKEVLFTVGGMHCAACSSRLERVLNGMDGVQSATVSLAANSATVVPDPALSESDTEALSDRLGSGPWIWGSPQRPWPRKPIWWTHGKRSSRKPLGGSRC